MRFPVSILIGLVMGGLLTGPGCGPSEPPPSLPPPPSERGEFSESSSTASRSAAIRLVLPSTSTLESILLVDAATKEAGNQKALLETRQPRAEDPPGAQADLIRRAARDGASAIIVLVNSDTPLTGAIDEVQRDGVPVVVVGDTLECETTPHRVDTVDFNKAAAELVTITIDQARREGLDVAQKPILLIREVTPDSHAEERIGALESALTAAGLEPIRVNYADHEADAANALQAALTEHPKTTLVFGDSDQSTLGASAVLDRSSQGVPTGDPAPFVFAGYLSDPIQVNAMRTSGSMVAFIDWNVPGVARAAVRDALRLSRKEKLPALTDVPTPVVRPRHSSLKVRPIRPEG